MTGDAPHPSQRPRDEESVPARRGRRARWLILLIAAVGLVVIAVVWIVLYQAAS